MANTKSAADLSIAPPDRDYELGLLHSESRSASPLPQPALRQLPPAAAVPLSQIANNPTASIVSYCLASISMTVVNKYVVSGNDWNLMFLYLAVQVSSR